MTENNVTMDISIDGIILKRSFLEELQHELVSLNGLKAFDAKGESTIVDFRVTVVPSDDLIDLKLTRLITLIDIALGKPNVHKDCEYYDIESDGCRNYAMGQYAGLSYNVSKHDKCIKDMEL